MGYIILHIHHETERKFFMFMPYFVDSTGKKHTFPDDFALKSGLIRAWQRGASVFDFQYRLKANRTNGHDYQLVSVRQNRDSFTVCFAYESALGKDSYCL